MSQQEQKQFWSKVDFENTGIKLPARIINIGSSVALVSFLDKSPRSFSKIVLCVKSVKEPLCRHLVETTPSDILNYYENGEIPPVEKYRSNRGHGLFIVDVQPMALPELPITITEWAIRCRTLGEYGFSFVYITQSFFAVPCGIRLQASHLFIKNLKLSDLNMILDDYPLGISKQQLINYYKTATKGKGKWYFLNIELDAEDECISKYRRGYNLF